MKIALGQINPTTGDLDGNANRIAEWSSEAAGAGAELIIFPELALSGYAADDLFGRRDFLAAAESTLSELAAGMNGINALVGFPEVVEATGTEGDLRIAASSVAVLADGAIQQVYRKRLLDRAGGVDQPGRFLPGDSALAVNASGLEIGVLAGSEYATPSLLPRTDLIAISGATPYERGSGRRREELLREAAERQRTWLALADHAGGQDELIFEGASTLISPEGEVVARAGQFSEALLICSAQAEPAGWLGDIEELYESLVAGVRDYVLKNGFSRVGFGMSGGLDSALVAAIAADALGPDRVSAVVMPSRHSSGETQSDAREMSERLGFELLDLAIEGPMAAFEDLLGDDATGLAAENLQARIRGSLLMSLSNSRGWLVLVTGNRSEAAVGYATLYGDMAGGLAPIQDVSKTVVFELCRYRNSVSPVIPESIIERPPSAELRPDQKDSDSLPDYEELDRILSLYIDHGLGLAGMVARGEDRDVAAEVIDLVDRSEYKRRQAPPGLRVSASSFSRDRRMPLTSRFAAGDQPTGQA